jgi:peptide/nickel transport system ATP-binding protein
MGFSEDIYLKPREEYTKNLIDSIPKGDLEDIRKNVLRRRILKTARLIREEIKTKHDE